MVFIVAGVATGRWAVIRFLTPTPFTVEDEIQQGAENLSSFTPSDAWDAWQFYQSAGFKEKNPAPYYRIKRVMELQDETMRTGAVVTAIAFVCLMAVLFAPKLGLFMLSRKR
jgi:pyruvate-formate lyase-activating enzyme